MRRAVKLGWPLCVEFNVVEMLTVIVFVSGALHAAGLADLWWMFVVLAVILAIAIFLLICCIYCVRYSGETYKGLYTSHRQ